jgi:integrase
MFYLLAVSTGLRRKELASLTVGNLHLDVIPSPYVELSGRDTKNGRGAHLPLRPDVVAELRCYLADLGDDLPLDRPLFKRPPTIRVFDADCQAAGIDKTDARGRVVDIYALRTTFCTHVAVAGVHPRVAQQAMRHSRMELTNQYYTDPILLDVAGAVNSLPDFVPSGVAESVDAANSSLSIA